ncbi:MAG: hypothetical protein AABN95_23325 [Acidobacteriota bacterium]
MKKLSVALVSLAVMLAGTSGVLAQGDAKPTPISAPAVAINATTTPIDLARAALAAQGGEKFKSVKSMVLRGSVDLYPPNSTQPLPGGFIIVNAGDKVRLEVDTRSPVSFKQIYDGEQSYSSLPGVSMPPFHKIGLAVLVKYDQPGYTVSAIPDKKKHRGFRIVDSEGFSTDFYIDPATGRVMSLVVPLEGHTFGTENKKFKEVDGVLVPSSFTWRMEMKQGAFFAEFNVKDIKLNNPIGDDVFAIPN